MQEGSMSWVGGLDLGALVFTPWGSWGIVELRAKVLRAIPEGICGCADYSGYIQPLVDDRSRKSPITLQDASSAVL